MRRMYAQITLALIIAALLGTVMAGMSKDAVASPRLTRLVSSSSTVTAPSRLVDRVMVGAYIHLLGHPFSDPVAPIDLATMEQELGHKFGLVHYFFAWGRPFNQALNTNVDGRNLMLTMDPTAAASIPDIAAGQQDAYIDQFARDAKAWGRPVYLRFAHEMNGNWSSYSSSSPGGPSATVFKAAWIRLATDLRSQGATNVKLVWSPNESDYPNIVGNHMEDYWPGDNYVDIAAFDAYNWSNQQPARGDGTWRSFDQLVAAPYARITSFTSRPIWLAEFGTTEAASGVDPVGANKGQWLRDMFNTTGFPRLTGIVYFSEDDTRDTQRDWRLDSSAASLTGFRDGWASKDTTPAPTSTTTLPSTTATSTTTPPNNQTVNLPEVSGAYGFSNNITRSVQTLLTARGFPTALSDVWTAGTTSNIVAFQQAKGIPVTGVVDALTWSRLLYG